MYFPFLRARQFELITLRELAIEGITQNFIFPILEPVKESHNNFTLAVRVFNERNQGFFFIVNPLVGEMPGDNTFYLDLVNQFNSNNIKVAFH